MHVHNDKINYYTFITVVRYILPVKLSYKIIHDLFVSWTIILKLHFLWNMQNRCKSYLVNYVHFMKNIVYSFVSYVILLYVLNIKMCYNVVYSMFYFQCFNIVILNIKLCCTIHTKRIYTHVNVKKRLHKLYVQYYI